MNKKIMNTALVGVLIGSMVFLLVVTSLQIVPSWFNTISVLLFSAIFGLTTFIYSIDRLTLLIKSVLHFVVLYILVAIMVSLNSWLTITEWFSLRILWIFGGMFILFWGWNYATVLWYSKKINKFL